MSTEGPQIAELEIDENITPSGDVQKAIMDEEDDIDETLTERLIGLTEMFPESVRNATSSLAGFSVSATKSLYRVCRSGLWIAASSACILALPVMFESERAAMEEQQLQQQRQILLGPNAAVSGGSSPGLMPGLAPQPVVR